MIAPTMRITDVQPILMSCPLPKPHVMPFYGGERTILKRDAMLIRIKTDTDLTGYAPGPAHERAAAEITAHIRQFLVGRDPLKWREYGFKGKDIEQQKLYQAVEIAVIDLAAKAQGCAMSELIGG